MSSGESASSTVTVAPAGPPPIDSSVRPTTAGWVLGLINVAVLGILLPMLLVGASQRSSLNGYVVVVLWGVCFFSAVRLGGFLVYRRARLILMAFYVFCYVFVGLTPLAQLAVGRFPNASHFATAASINDDDVIVRTATLFLIGIVAHEVAYLVGGRRRGRRSRRTPPSANGVRDLVAALNVPVVQLLCVAGVLISVIAVTGRPGAVLHQPRGGRQRADRDRRQRSVGLAVVPGVPRRALCRLLPPAAPDAT